MAPQCISPQKQPICSITAALAASTIRAMENGTSFVRVLGIGHLAAATRLHLQHLRLRASDTDRWIDAGGSERAALFLACSDFENIVSRRALAARARADHSTILFACLRSHGARVGPLITPVATESAFAYHLTRSWDFSPAIYSPLPTHGVDTRATHLARIGASFIIRELAKFLVDRVTEIDPPVSHGIYRGQGFPEVDAGTLVASHDDWREAAGLPVRSWHPAAI